MTRLNITTVWHSLNKIYIQRLSTQHLYRYERLLNKYSNIKNTKSLWQGKANNTELILYTHIFLFPRHILKEAKQIRKTVTLRCIIETSQQCILKTYSNTLGIQGKLENFHYFTQ